MPPHVCVDAVVTIPKLARFRLFRKNVSTCVFNLHHAFKLYYALYALSHLVGLTTIKSEGRSLRGLWRAGVGEGGARSWASVGEHGSQE